MVTPAKTSEQEAIALINRAFGLDRPRRVHAQVPATQAAVAEARAKLDAMKAQAIAEQAFVENMAGEIVPVGTIYTFGGAKPAVAKKAA